MDLTRGLAVLLVVIYHSGSFMRFALVYPPAVVIEVIRLFAPFGMPALIFLSGLLTPASLRKGPPKYVEGKLRYIAWPHLVWTSVYVVMTWPMFHPFGYLRGDTYLWYLAFLLVYYAVALLTVRVPPLVVATVAFALSVAAADGTKYGERFWLLMSFFFLGAAAARAPRAWAWLLGSRLVLAPAVVGAVVVVLYAQARDATSTTIFDGYNPSTALGSAAGVVVIIRLARIVGQRRGLTPLRFVGRHSIIYYASHVPTIYCVAHFCRWGGLTSPWVIFALGMGSALLLATVCALLVERRPALGLGWLFSWRPRRQAVKPRAVTVVA